jgi:maleamate amidohydrolase
LIPRDDELIVTKQGASAFFQTGLHEYLQARDVDTLLIAGLSTSGCVRATVVDGAAYGYRVAVIVDAVADRIQLSHRVTLLDIWMKYGDLMSADQAHVALSESPQDAATS